jgi:hypothetical protein
MTVAPITAPNRYDSKVWRSATRRMAFVTMAVSET